MAARNFISRIRNSARPIFGHVIGAPFHGRFGAMGFLEMIFLAGLAAIYAGDARIGYAFLYSIDDGFQRRAAMREAVLL